MFWKGGRWGLDNIPRAVPCQAEKPEPVSETGGTSGKRKRGKKKKKSGEKKGKKKGDKHTHTNCSVACEQGMGAEREE